MIETTQVEKVKQFNLKYVKDNLNEYEKVVIVALNDWHTPQLRNVMAYTDKVNPNACINDHKTTFLHYASGKQDSMNEKSIGPINILIEAGADIFALDSEGLTPYQYAKIKNNTVNQALLKKQYMYLKAKYENASSVLNALQEGKYVLQGQDNNENKRVLSLVEYNHYVKTKEEFEKNNKKWNGT